MFQAMNDGIREESVRYLFNFQLPSEKAAQEAAMRAEQVEAEKAAKRRTEQSAQAAHMASMGSRLTYSSAAKDGTAEVSRTDSSGKKATQPPADGLNRKARRAAEKAEKKSRKRN